MRPIEVIRAPFGAHFCLDKYFDFLKGEAVLEVVLGGIFLHDVLGYGGIFQSLHLAGVNLELLSLELGSLGIFVWSVGMLCGWRISWLGWLVPWFCVVLGPSLVTCLSWVCHLSQNPPPLFFY